MAENLTAKFDTLSQAEAAATKLRSIRANDVEICHWDRPLGNTDVEFAMEDINYTGYVPFVGGGSYPSIVSGLGGAAGLSGMLPYAASDEYSPSRSGQGYLLNASIDKEQHDQAVRIISECGGNEL
jgi:hypothetical protein